MRFESLKKACAEANRALHRTGLVDLTFGNLSIYDPGPGVFAIKPSGVPYEELEAGHIVVLDMEGRVVEGDLRPSSDTPTHRKLFLAFGASGVRSVVHTHSHHAVAFAQAGRGIPCLGTTHADYFHGEVPVTRSMREDEVVGAYEWETGQVIAEALEGRNPMDCPAVLVRHHGPFVWGGSAAKAIEHAQALEIVGEMALKALQLNPAQKAVPSFLLDKHFYRKHGDSAYYGQK